MPGSSALRRLGRALAIAGIGLVQPAAAETLKIDIAVIVPARAPSPPYVIDPAPPGEGVDGARLALRENATTGAFLDQEFALSAVELGEGEDAVAAVKPLLAQGKKLFVSALAAEETAKLADALAAEGALLFNAGAADDVLRGAGCRPNLFHTAPSRAMLADALAQYFAVRRWSKILLVPGPNPADAAYAQAFRAAAKKFGLKIVAEKPWTFGPLARARADAVTQSEALVFARGIEADLIVVADEAEDFGDFILYRTAEPRLVAGTQGLTPAAWHPTHTAYGAEQLQNRFVRQANRRMRPIDYQAWIAVRAIGQAVTDLRAADPAKIAATLRTPAFNLAVFKGAAASFRPWDGQLRQPLLLAQPRSLIGLSPQPGFLHQRTALDTLGADEPDSACPLKKGIP